jgi:hypothetical protein
LGEFADAERRLAGARATVLAAASAEPANALLQTWTGQMFWLLREQGRLGEPDGQEILRQARRHSFFPVWRAALALADAEAGRSADAADHVAALLAETSELAALPPHGWATPTLAVLAETLDLLADTDQLNRSDLAGVVELTERHLAPHRGEIALAGWPAALLGPVTRSIALLALAAGDPTRALADLAEAETAVGAARPQLARIRADRARALRALGDPTAPALLRTAHHTATTLGMTTLATRLTP